MTELFSGNIILFVASEILMENNPFVFIKRKALFRGGGIDMPWEFQNKGVS